MPNIAATSTANSGPAVDGTSPATAAPNVQGDNVFDFSVDACLQYVGEDPENRAHLLRAVDNGDTLTGIRDKFYDQASKVKAQYISQREYTAYRQMARDPEPNANSTLLATCADETCLCHEQSVTPYSNHLLHCQRLNDENVLDNDSSIQNQKFFMQAKNNDEMRHETAKGKHLMSA